MPALNERRLDVSFSGRTVFGLGAAERVGELARGFSVRGAFLVTGLGVLASGAVEIVRASLEEAGLAVSVFASVMPNPATSDVESGSASLLDFGKEDVAVVAVGGGSSMDAAKGISLHAVNGGSVLDLDYRKTPDQSGLPVLAVPTTSGTGSETNGFGVIMDHGSGRKFYVGHTSAQPKTAVLDPLLTLGLPPGSTAATGIDALTHALESLMSRNSNPYAEGLALQVIQMVSKWLPAAVHDGGSVEARSQMLLAAHLAGLAFSSGTGLGLCHAVAHSLSARLDVAHGVALAAVLPAVMTFNLPSSTRELALTASSMGVYDSGTSEDENARSAVAATEALVWDLMGRRTLASLGVDEGLLPTLVQDTIEDGVLLNTPRMPTPEEVENLLVAAP